MASRITRVEYIISLAEIGFTATFRVDDVLKDNSTLIQMLQSLQPPLTVDEIAAIQQDPVLLDLAARALPDYARPPVVNALKERKDSMADSNPPVFRQPDASPPPPPKIPAWVNPKTWPTWLKYLVAPIAILALTFYYRDQRVGNGFFAKPPTVELWPSPTVSARFGWNGVTIVYGDKRERSADGLVVAIVTEDDDKKNPAQLADWRHLWQDSDFPVVVFLNASGFDPSGLPTVIRRASDGKVLFDAKTPKRAALVVPKHDPAGGCDVYDDNGKDESVSEKDWYTKYLRSDPPPDPKDLEKMSDEELRKRGYERVPGSKPPEPVKEKDKPPEFPKVRVPERKK